MYCTYCTDILCTIRYQLHELHVGVCMYMCVSSVAMCCVCTCVYPRIHHIFETNCGKLIRTDCNKGSNWSRQLSIEVDLVVLLLFVDLGFDLCRSFNRHIIRNRSKCD